MYAKGLRFPADERASRNKQQSESGTQNTWPALMGIKVVARPPGHGQMLYHQLGVSGTPSLQAPLHL